MKEMIKMKKKSELLDEKLHSSPIDLSKVT